MKDYKFIGKPIKLFAKQTITRYAFIAVLSIIMGLMIGYLAGNEEPSFGKDFMIFYTYVFGGIATVFIVLMVIDYRDLYNVYVLKRYRVYEEANK